jgi:hypothetical protein
VVSLRLRRETTGAGARNLARRLVR